MLFLPHIMILSTSYRLYDVCISKIDGGLIISKRRRKYLSCLRFSDRLRYTYVSSYFCYINVYNRMVSARISNNEYGIYIEIMFDNEHICWHPIFGRNTYKKLEHRYYADYDNMLITIAKNECYFYHIVTDDHWHTL